MKDIINQCNDDLESLGQRQGIIEGVQENILFLSKFAHLSTQGDMGAYFNSIKMLPIYFPQEYIQYIKEFKEGGNVREIMNKLDTIEDREIFHNLISGLQEADVLVDSSEFDIENINHFKSVMGKPYINIAYFVLTDECNFKCKYCFVRNPMSNSYKSSFMTEETAIKGLDFFSGLTKLRPDSFNERKSIIFYGGEPLMNKKVFKTTLEKIRQYQEQGKLSNDIKITLITNGSLIDQETIELVKEYNILIAISIDGDQAMNNKNRIYKDGHDTHDKIIEGYNLCVKNGIHAGISCTISEDALERKGALLSSLIDDYKATNIGFNMLFSTKEYEVSEEYNKKAADFIVDAYKIFREKNIYEDRIMRKVEAFANSKNIVFDCGAVGGSQIVIAPDGDVGICQAYLGNRKHFVTNVSDQEFDPSQNEEYQERSKRSPFNMEQCQDCEGLGICGGGCAYQAEEKEGSIRGLDKRFCEFTKTTMEFLVWDLYENLSKEENQDLK